MLKETLLFDPQVMAQNEVSMIRNLHDDNKISSFQNRAMLSKEQFALSEEDATLAQSLHQLFIAKYWKLIRISDPRVREQFISEVTKPLAEYHELISTKSGLFYNIESAILEEFKMYKEYLEGNILKAVESTAFYFSVIYDIPQEELMAAMKARERGLTIMRGLHVAKATEDTWNAMEESFTSYYQLLRQALLFHLTENVYS